MTRQEAATALGVSADATQAEVKRAFRAAAACVHPDRPGGDEAAYRVLVEACGVLLGRIEETGEPAGARFRSSGTTLDDLFAFLGSVEGRLSEISQAISDAAPDVERARDCLARAREARGTSRLVARVEAVEAGLRALRRLARK